MLKKKLEVFDGGELLLELKKGRFSIIIFEDYNTYLTLDPKNKQSLLNYCSKNKVGIISFIGFGGDNYAFEKETGAEIVSNEVITHLHFSNNSRVPFIAKKNNKLSLSEKDGSGWTIFYPQKSSSFQPFIACEDSGGINAAVAIHDNGINSNVEHIIFGQNLQHFFIKIAFWDSLLYMSRGSFNWSLDTYIQIDIDDVFVGQTGTRLVTEDIFALIESQNFLRKYIKGFNYTLGFSGHFFRRGDKVENEADEILVAQSHNFLWFPHMWHHNHPQEYELTYLAALMTQNKLFAENLNFRTILSYAVSPQHSGVYPIHEPLYEAWKTIWNIQFTSTEEYPHLRPAWDRRAFIHKNITVLPRQTCGLFTHTHFFHAYPDGIENLKRNIFGGDLFSTILLNQFLIFMTHQQNYGHDRLAHYTFHNEILFLQCWTNLNLKWVEPEKLSNLYFNRFPQEKNIIHLNRCADDRHRKMLSANVTCENIKLPNLVIVGPQKTGTSALLSFLKLHPNVTSNINIEGSFEEMQFFGGTNYEKGFDWYSSKFQAKDDHQIIVEKTANYFDNPVTPHLLSSMLNPESKMREVKIIIMITDPVDRAYSWYQHMLSHNDSTAMKYSAEKLFSMPPDDPKYEETNRLRQRCLKPGHYAEHLDRWLDYFLPSQIILIDAKAFRLDPTQIMDQLLIDLNLSTSDFTYSTNLKYVPEKGFHCSLISGKTKCLGASKGRKYLPISDSLRSQLNSYYAGHNRALIKLLIRYKFNVPGWLLNF
uniref:[heparan sulfate]-glucosamine N-sulfotransferase n=1 Tax=Panagrolaimus sp. PS1159 TaxID=55785 RepID=A0AC35FTS7_9BILA